MNTYTKFLIKTYLFSLLNIFFIFFCLIYVLNLLTELEFFKQTDVGTYFPLYLSLINTPMFVFEMFPFIFLISTQLFFNTLFTYDEMNIFKYSGLKNTKIFSILSFTIFFVGIIIISIFYNLSSNLKNLYLGLKSNYTDDKKYLAVITNNGLWIKDIYNENIMIINASSFNNNELVDTYISEFDKDFEIRYLEYFDERKNFIYNDWQNDYESGYIKRSRYTDYRNDEKTINYSSLIIDAILKN